MAETHVSIKELSDQNYTIWKFKMQLLLSREKVLKVVSEEKPEAPEPAWLAKDEKARALIGLALEDSQLIHVMQTTTSKEMWDALKGYHERASLSSKIHVMRLMFTTRMPEGGNKGEHLKQLTSLRLRLIALGEEMKDPSFVALMLSSLPKSYDGLIIALESRPDADLTVDFVKGKLLDEGRRRMQEGVEEEKALASSGVSDKMRNKSEKKNDKKKEKVCHYCKKDGHFRRDCRKLIADRKAKEDSETANVAAEPKDKVDLCLFVGRGEETGLWFFDSGATSHMTNNAAILERLDKSKQSSIALADGQCIRSAGVGSSRLVSVNGNGGRMNVSLDNVYHVPSLATNLLSVSKITDLGLQVTFNKDGCRVLKGDSVVLVGQR